MNPARLASLVAAAGALSFASVAHAYLDPGTGSILLQGLIAAIAGGLVVGRLYWAKFKNLFSLSKGDPEQEARDTDDNAPK